MISDAVYERMLLSGLLPKGIRFLLEHEGDEWCKDSENAMDEMLETAYELLRVMTALILQFYFFSKHQSLSLNQLALHILTKNTDCNADYEGLFFEALPLLAVCDDSESAQYLRNMVFIFNPDGSINKVRARLYAHGNFSNTLSKLAQNSRYRHYRPRFEIDFFLIVEALFHDNFFGKLQLVKGKLFLDQVCLFPLFVHDGPLTIGMKPVNDICFLRTIENFNTLHKALPDGCLFKSVIEGNICDLEGRFYLREMDRLDFNRRCGMDEAMNLCGLIKASIAGSFLINCPHGSEKSGVAANLVNLLETGSDDLVIAFRLIDFGMRHLPEVFYGILESKIRIHCCNSQGNFAPSAFPEAEVRRFLIEHRIFVIIEDIDLMRSSREHLLRVIPGLSAMGIRFICFGKAYPEMIQFFDNVINLNSDYPPVDSHLIVEQARAVLGFFDETFRFNPEEDILYFREIVDTAKMLYKRIDKNHRLDLQTFTHYAPNKHNILFEAVKVVTPFFKTLVVPQQLSSFFPKDMSNFSSLTKEHVCTDFRKDQVTACMARPTLRLIKGGVG